MAVKHRIRGRKEGTSVLVSLTGASAIHKFCVECMGFCPHDVKGCTSLLCPLYPFRMGHYPKDHTPLTPDEAKSRL